MTLSCLTDMEVLRTVKGEHVTINMSLSRYDDHVLTSGVMTSDYMTCMTRCRGMVIEAVGYDDDRWHDDMVWVEITIHRIMLLHLYMEYQFLDIRSNIHV